MMYSVARTLEMNGIDVRRWLGEWLTACAENGGKPPDDRKRCEQPTCLYIEE